MDNKSCVFISLKYTLIAFLLIDLINSLIALTAVIALIDNSTNNAKTEKINENEVTTTSTVILLNNNNTETANVTELTETNVTEKSSLMSYEQTSTPVPVRKKFSTKTLISHSIYNLSVIFFTIMGLVGVSGENFFISIFTACVMVTEGTLVFFIYLTSPSILTILFNYIIAVLAILYAIMIKCTRESLIINRVEPIVTSNQPSQPIMATHLNGSLG